jgi:hypothetical protein
MVGGGNKEDFSVNGSTSFAPLRRNGRRSSLANGAGGHGARKFHARRMSMVSPGVASMTKPMMRSRVSPMELNMKRTEMVARGMARRRGTLMHDSHAHSRFQKKDLPHRMDDLIRFSLEDLWKRNRRTAQEQTAIDKKALQLFPPRNRIFRRASVAVAVPPTTTRRVVERRPSMSSIQKTSRLRFAFLKKFWSLGERICNLAATRVQAQMRGYLRRCHYRIVVLKRKWARIEYEKIQEVRKIGRKTKSRKKVYKKKTMQELEDIAEQAKKARKVTDHLKRENRKIKDQNQRLQQLCYKLKKVNGHMEKTIGIHNKNFRSMWEFHEKMKDKKKRIEDKVARYEARIDTQTKNLEVYRIQAMVEIAHKELLASALEKISRTVAARSQNDRLIRMVGMMASGETVDEAFMAEIDAHEEDVVYEREEWQQERQASYDNLAQSFHDTFVFDSDEEESVNDGFFLDLDNDDASSISDVSSVVSEFDESFSHKELDGSEPTGRDGYVEVEVIDEHGNRRTELVCEEELLDDSEYEIVVSSDEEDDDDATGIFSCQSSVYVDQGSIIM